jgi:hypothetical protein
VPPAAGTRIRAGAVEYRSRMRITAMLCDHAEVAEGKLFINGGGWTVIGPGPMPTALALVFEVPWDRANTRIHFQIRLLDEDGHPVLVPGPNGPGPVEIGGDLEVGRPPGLAPGSDLSAPLAIPVPPLALPPGRYLWDVTAEGAEPRQLAFAVRGDG